MSRIGEAIVGYSSMGVVFWAGGYGAGDERDSAAGLVIVRYFLLVGVFAFVGAGTGPKGRLKSASLSRASSFENV